MELYDDMRDGHNLISLLEVLSHEVLVSLFIINHPQVHQLKFKHVYFDGNNQISTAILVL